MEAIAVSCEVRIVLSGLDPCDNLLTPLGWITQRDGTDQTVGIGSWRFNLLKKTARNRCSAAKRGVATWRCGCSGQYATAG